MKVTEAERCWELEKAFHGRISNTQGEWFSLELMVCLSSVDRWFACPSTDGLLVRRPMVCLSVDWWFACPSTAFCLSFHANSQANTIKYSFFVLMERLMSRQLPCCVNYLPQGFYSSLLLLFVVLSLEVIVTVWVLVLVLGSSYLTLSLLRSISYTLYAIRNIR
jgi:hypothetical protein